MRYKPDQVSLLLSEVRRKFEHQIPTSENTKGKYLEPTLASTEPSSSRPKGKTRSRIQFLCIPYFLLKQLPTHTFSVTSDIHPTRTLLQIQDPSTSVKRDMQQEFIAHFSNTDEEFDQTYDVIYKQSIQRPKDWSDSSSSGAKRPKLDCAIKEKDDALSDAVARPPPASIDSKEVAPVDQQSRDMTEKDGMNPQDHMPVERQTQWSINTSQLGDNTSMSVSRETFHLCYWLSAAPAQSTDAVTVEKDTPSAATNPIPEQNTTTFDVDLTKINKYIIELTAHIEQTLNPSFNPHARQYPVDCMPRGLAEVETRLAEIKNSCDTTTNSQSWPSADFHGRRGRARTENSSDLQDLPASHWDGRDSEQSQKMHCQRIFRLAEQVYQFLLPLRGSSLESWVTTKFWGAIYWYIENPEAEGTKSILDYAIRHDLKGKLCTIAEDLQYGPHPGTIQIPDDFCQVGHHLIAIFLWGTCKIPRNLLWRRFQTCQNLLVDGRRRLLHSMAPEDLDTMEAVLPVGIAALVVNRLMKDITEDAPDIVSTYYDYMLRLEQDVQKRPHSRVHQEKLSSFRQETKCIIRVLEDQIGVVSQLQQMLDKGEDVIATLGRRREDFILGGCLTTLEDRISNINSLERHARDLASFVRDLFPE
ncbi:MAG: hypothetical protein Q9199_000820 [Rusavskia elegans]